jgi:hypothetical protein
MRREGIHTVSYIGDSEMTTKTAVKDSAKNAVKNSVEMREKRAQAIAAMNLVAREGDRFKVGTPGLRNRQQFYEVWRDDNAKVRCTCLEFEENIGDDAAFRCEHILAVKHSLLAKNTEPAANQPAPLKPVVPAMAVVETNDATEERETSERSELELNTAKGKAATNGRAAVREAIEARQQLAKEAEQQKKPEADEFADTLDKEENTMRKNNNAASFAEVEKQSEVYEQDAQSSPKPSNVVAMPFNQTLQALRAHVEPHVVKQREGWRDRNGNVHMVDYVEWHTVADILDRVAPQWSHTIRDIKQIGDSIAVTAAITIDGVTREGIGTGSADNEMGIKKAEHDALKRAAVKFGIARELYRKESDVIERDGSSNNPNGGGFPANPVAKSLADLVTPKQLGMIRALGREAGVDVDEECTAVMSCKTDELSKKAASAFIQHLQDAQAGKAEQAQPAPQHNGLRRVS